MKMMKERIYEAMQGMYMEDADYVIEGIEIKDEFADSSVCDELCKEVYEAKIRLYEKMNVEEDADVEKIIMCMDDIAKELAMKMFGYGMQYAQKMGKNEA